MRRVAEGPPPAEAATDAKRARTRADDAWPFRDSLFSEDSISGVNAEFRAGKPFVHAVLANPFERQFLENVRDEIISNLHATPKETDLFKVFQTGDLMNIDGLDGETAARLSHLMQLRNALYSERFRRYMEQVAGLAPGTLIDKTDCSSNCYAHGGHLLCHDDVISTRCVSFILYLTDPSLEWEEQDGGFLELYPLEDELPGAPTTVPDKCLPPSFNTLAFFTVQPGVSFHAVQEVYTDNPAKNRLSISGWYHATDAPTGAGAASLSDLKSASAAVPRVLLGHGLDAEDFALENEEKQLLAQWVNPTYLSRSSVRRMVAEWESSRCVTLHNFLVDGVAGPILEGIRAEDQADALGDGRVPTYTAGCRGGWQLRGPSQRQRYLHYSGVTTQSNGCSVSHEESDRTDGGVADKLVEIRDTLLKSSAFAKWLLQVTDLVVRDVHSEVRRFRPGLDYTVACTAPSGMPTLDVTLCFVDDRDETKSVSSLKSAAWASDEVGGFQCYMTQDEEANEAAETYRAEAEEDSVISCSAAFNTLNILLRDDILMKFVKYMSHDAPSSRFDIALEFGTDLQPDEV